jgi:hypothetical protein
MMCMAACVMPQTESSGGGVWWGIREEHVTGYPSWKGGV